MDKNLREILDQIYAEGYEPGTPQFAFILRKRKVERCKELRNVSSCHECSYFDSCDLVKTYMKDLAEIQQRHHVRMVEEKKIKEAHVKGGALPGAVPATAIGGLPQWEVASSVGHGDHHGVDQPWGQEEALTGITGTGGDGSGVPAPRPPRQPTPGGSDAAGGGAGSSKEDPDG